MNAFSLLSRLFTLEKHRIASAIPYAHIEHIGSSAVYGLKGSGNIDIALQVLQQEQRKATDALTRLGYLEKQALFPGLSSFHQNLQDPMGGMRKYNVHLLPEGHREWQRFLRFRNCLRASSDACRQYEEIKK
ncbi:MAG: GrpB family protein [Chlamydiae bacterium]|nr:GrpB family protein [Chlamydiota bacterium]